MADLIQDLTVWQEELPPNENEAPWVQAGPDSPELDFESAAEPSAEVSPNPTVNSNIPLSINSLASALEALLAEAAASESASADAAMFADEAPSQQGNPDFSAFSFDAEPDPESETSSDQAASAFDSLFEAFDQSELGSEDSDWLVPVEDLQLEPEINTISPEFLQIPDEFLLPEPVAAEPSTDSPELAADVDSEPPAGLSPDSLAIEIDLSLLDQLAAPEPETDRAQAGESLNLDDFGLELPASDPRASGPDSGADSPATQTVGFTAESWFTELDSSPAPVPEVQPDSGLDSFLAGNLELEPPAEPNLSATEQRAEQVTAADLFQFDLPTDAEAPANPVEPEPAISEQATEIIEGSDLPAAPAASLGSDQLADLFIPDQFSDQFPDQFDNLENLVVDLDALETVPDLADSLSPDLSADSTSELPLLGSDVGLEFGEAASAADASWLAFEPIGELSAQAASDVVSEVPEAPLEVAGSEPDSAELWPAEAPAWSLDAETLEQPSAVASEALAELELPDLTPTAQASEIALEAESDQTFAGQAAASSVLENWPEAETEVAPSSSLDGVDLSEAIISSSEPNQENDNEVVDDEAINSGASFTEAQTDLQETPIEIALPNPEPTESFAEPETQPVAEVSVPPLVSPVQPASESSTEAEAFIQPPTQPVIQPTPGAFEALPSETSGAETSESETSESEAAASVQDETALDDSILAQLDQLLAPPAVELAAANSAQWCLGIDIGTTGLSAVLLNQAECQLYPIYWQAVAPTGEATGETAKKQFRLSTQVGLATAAVTEPTASPLPTLRPAQFSSTSAFQLSDWKPFLKIALPHHSPQTSQWEPLLQWTTEQTLPLRTLQEVLQELLLTLNPARTSVFPVTCGALGLEAEQFATILQSLSTVVLGHPSNWLDAYSFNLREAVLQAELVSQPGQVVFVEEAMAALLSALPAADGRPLLLSPGQGQSGHVQNANWQGMTLILTAGASVTELVLVNLPPRLRQLNSTDFYVRSLAYAGQSLDQDIIGQVLYPALMRAAQMTELEADIASGPSSPKPELNPDFSLPLIDADTLDSLIGFSALPAAAELAPIKRHQLQQRLLSSELGQQLLATAHALKITLQHQSQFKLQSGDELLVLERQDLTSQVFLPYVQRLNRELNTLLAQTNTTATAIQQVICTGGTASAGVMTRWLRQKLPNATIVQDTYARPALPSDRQISSCSRIAYGLATLPLHSQVIDWSRHCYSDYYLLAELLRTLPQQPLRVEAIMDLLQQRGINTQACRFRILALLDGHLPAGLVPAEADAALLMPQSAANPDYQAIRLAPLLHKPADRTYEPNRAQWAYLQYYLETLLADTEQTLSAPLEQGLGLPVE